MISVLYFICPHTQQTLLYFFLSFFMFCKTNIFSLFFVLFYNFLFQSHQTVALFHITELYMEMSEDLFCNDNF